MSQLLRVLCLGDIVGRPGRALVCAALRTVRAQHGVHLVVANGENASGGRGLDPENAKELRAAGVDVITLGDHTWQVKQIKPFLQGDPSWCVRPANYPPSMPGRGWTTLQAPPPFEGVSVAVCNLMGRVMMSAVLDCPFRAADQFIKDLPPAVHVRIVDMHAEATSEKVAMLRYLSGRVSLLFGTHTHVPTADTQVDAAGTAYVSDLGMCGPVDGVIGMRSEAALERFLSGGHVPYEVADGKAVLSGILCDIDVSTGKAAHIERLSVSG
ncbi:MAG: TIGR00282 family metallophosphoesterase [Bdellovibrionota bacterium]|nr:MAG: TIGR00282 family metallophosphoesterase [Bdellovibrionota bacterium]